MMSDENQRQYAVLPVSALKSKASFVFEELSAGRSVYVSRHGQVVAAFRPFEAVPKGVAAMYSSPTSLSTTGNSRLANSEGESHPQMSPLQLKGSLR